MYLSNIHKQKDLMDFIKRACEKQYTLETRINNASNIINPTVTAVLTVLVFLLYYHGYLV